MNESLIHKIKLNQFKQQISNECICDYGCYIKGNMPICCFKCESLQKCIDEDVCVCEESICPLFESK